jgi:hypothetical protein
MTTGTIKTMVTVRMLQGMAGEHLTLEPGDLYQTTVAQAKLWADHRVAELVKPGASARPAQTTR